MEHAPGRFLFRFQRPFVVMKEGGERQTCQLLTVSECGLKSDGSDPSARSGGGPARRVREEAGQEASAEEGGKGRRGWAQRRLAQTEAPVCLRMDSVWFGRLRQ